jgi:hypothetical protein
MSASDTLENDLLKLIFQKTLPSYLGTLSGTGNADFYLSLHTADPGEAGSQTTSEAAYGSYVRKAVARTSGGWTITANSATNAGLVQFDKSTSTGADVRFVGVGTASSGAGTLLLSLQLATDTPTTTGIQPQFDAETLTFTVS